MMRSTVVIIWIIEGPAAIQTVFSSPMWHQSGYLSLNHICNFKWLPISDLQLLHHFFCNVDGSVRENVKGKKYISNRTCRRKQQKNFSSLQSKGINYDRTTAGLYVLAKFKSKVIYKPTVSVILSNCIKHVVRKLQQTISQR